MSLRNLTLLLALSWLSILTSCSAPKVSSNAAPVEHRLWDSLLRQHVDESGLVNYKNFLQDTQQLQSYLDLLRNNPPDTRSWSEAQQMAYWINAYNAFTVELILDHYPVVSIKDIKNGVPFVNSVWDI
ncbi:MAG: DUF547 domain-containing protein, partial [Bacteroidota bacterium]